MANRGSVSVEISRCFLGTRVAIVAWLAAAGCAGVPLGADPPAVELVNLTLLEATPDEQHYALTFLIENPNAEPIPVLEIVYSVRLAGQGYLNGRSPTSATVPGSGRQTVRVDLKTSGVVSASRLASFVQGPDDSLPYELSGELVIGGAPPPPPPLARAGGGPVLPHPGALRATTAAAPGRPPCRRPCRRWRSSSPGSCPHGSAWRAARRRRARRERHPATRSACPAAAGNRESW